MISFDYHFIQDIFERIWGNTELTFLMNAFKGIAISFVIIRYVFVIFKDQVGKKEIEFGSNKVSLPISFYNILYYAFMVALILSYDKLIYFMDTILGMIIANYEMLQNTPVTREIAMAEAADSSMSALEAMKQMALEFMMVLTNPLVALLKGIEGVVWLLDAIIYGYFLGLRFFAILILKFTGPAAIALSLLPKFGHVFGKWVGLYARWWLLIIPFLLVNIVVSGFMESYEVMFDGFADGENMVTSAAIAQVRLMTQVPLLVLITILKLGLYILSKKVYEELITVNENEND